MGVYFSDKGATSQLRSVYLIFAQFLPATVVSAWLSSSHLPWKGSPTILLMVHFVDDIFLSDVWISELFRPLFVSCVLLFPSKALEAWLLPPNELMVDLTDDPSVIMAEMEAYILDFLMFSSEIVASNADFSRFFLFHSFRSGRPLCRAVELSLLRLDAWRALRIYYQWVFTESLNHFFSGYVPWNTKPLLS